MDRRPSVPDDRRESATGSDERGGRFSRRAVLSGVGTALTGTAMADVAVAEETAREAGELLWEFTEPSGEIRSSPTVVDGTVYVGSLDGALYAVDAESGTEQWVADGVNPHPGSSPTVADGTVYVGCGHDSVVADSKYNALYAVDAATGETEWVFREPDSPVQNSPTVVGDTVFAASAADVYAFDAATGRQEWVFDEADGSIYSSPTVADGTVYVGCSDDTLYAIDAVTGEQEWTFTDPSDWIFSSPTVTDGTVYVMCNDDTLYAVDAATGRREWAFDQIVPWDDSSPTVADGTVYVGGIPGRGEWEDVIYMSLYAVDAATGELEWKRNLDLPAGAISSPTVAAGTVYVGTGHEALQAVDAATGEQVWTFPSESVNDASHVGLYSPTVADGIVYAAGESGILYAISTDHSRSGEGSRARLGSLGHAGDRGTDHEPTTISGSVSGSSGDSPVAGATVSIDGEVRATTDDAGAFTLELAPGVYELVVEADGYRSHRRSLTIDPSRTGPKTVAVGLEATTPSGTPRPTETPTQTPSLAEINGSVPRDLDGDGVHRDLNANGAVDYDDVVTYFEHMDEPVMTDHAAAYDYNGNGQVDFADLVDLFEQV